MTDKTKLDRETFLKGKASKKLLLLNGSLSLLYLAIISFGFRPGNHLLFDLLIVGECFHVMQVIGFVHTTWSQKLTAAFSASFRKPVDVFITVCGEPVEIVRETAQAALAMDYPKHKVYILNDGFVAKRDNWHEIEKLAKELGVTCITRRKPGGAKAGNINNALKKTRSPYVAVFDADHVPQPNFLKETMGYFVNPRMGFVQTPQFYKNQHQNVITQAAWDQQALFFGPIMSGKNRTNSAFMCGTNMVISREALLQAGGMCEFNIAEDFLTSLFIHDKKWQSVYVPKVLAEGLAPEDFLTYYKQQFRWMRGSLEVVFKHNPLFKRGLSAGQRIQYLVSASYWLSGLVILLDALLPVVFLLTGITAVTTSTMALAMVFIPYIFLNLYVLQKAANFTFTFSAIGFSLSAFYLEIRAIIAVLLGQKTSFAVTSKKQLEGNFLYLATPQIAYVCLVVAALVVGLVREGLSASLLANLAWTLVNVATCSVFIYAATPEGGRQRHHVPTEIDRIQKAEREFGESLLPKRLDIAERTIATSEGAGS